MERRKKNLTVIGCLIVVTCAALAYAGHRQRTPVSAVPESMASHHKGVSLAAGLVQDKVCIGDDASVDVALTLQADDGLPAGQNHAARFVDMVIVLDRSGSMQGQKITDARRAVENLLTLLSPNDRFALISYSGDVCLHCALTPVTGEVQAQLGTMLEEIRAGGGTNLGAGLQAGLQTLATAVDSGRPGRVILISDGLANQGVTDLTALSQMAATAVSREFSVSTVGVGDDFNERLMTALADHGTGTYHYLENPAAFAGVFEREFRSARAVTAGMVAVEMVLPDGVSLTHAAGYPIERQGHLARFYPGDLLAGQTRKLFLKLHLQPKRRQTYRIDRLAVTYRSDGKPCRVSMPDTLEIVCVDNREDVMASVDKKEWTQKVLQADYNDLREAVADEIRRGDEQQAMRRIERYRAEKEVVNAVVGSEEVAGNLQNDLEELRQTVKKTFCGAPAAVAQKQKKNAKALQFEGYKGKRRESSFMP